MTKIQIGQVFGRLTVIAFKEPRRERGTNKAITMCLCKCTCGKEVVVRGKNLTSGHTSSCGCFRKETSRSRVGALASNYKTTMTDEERAAQRFARKDPAYAEWRRAVFTRDGGKCVVCGSKGRGLEAHHLFSFTTHPKLRYVVENGATVCKKCHKAYHIDFMGGYYVPATRESFKSFISHSKSQRG